MHLVDKILVVIKSNHGAVHCNVVVVVESLVETLDIADENLTLPLLCRDLRVLVMVQKESELQTTGVKDALIAFTSNILALSVSKDCEGQNRSAQLIEAGLGLAGKRCDTSSESLNCFIVQA